ncbi:CDGSH iron-sulfur domain-containing protein 2-like [Tubulanus polymorphus]|uniref:CDGSH iron-sulfur domain-containing protein 2-like n=1 Tax=Tubulanus polymorphus TaxID=672921 RepID=UPI003DA5B515
MEAIAQFLHKSLPKYLERMPFPDSISDIAEMSGQDWMRLLPFLGIVSFLTYATVRVFIPNQSSTAEDPRSKWVNEDIQKDCPKVADVMNIEDLGNKTAYCRCWKSKKFPYCDGSHTAHNKATGDNVGPVVLKRDG